MLRMSFFFIGIVLTAHATAVKLSAFENDHPRIYSNVTREVAETTAGTEPQITTQPQHADVVQDTPATLSVVATGLPAPTYQWYRGISGDTSRPIAGATGAVYVSPAGATVVTPYWVRVTNTAGSVASVTARVTPWTKLEQAIASSLRNVGDGTLRVRTASALLTSSDGIRWQRHENATGMEPIAYGNATYVGAVNDSAGSTIYSSLDGKTWTQRAISSTAQTTGIAFGSGQFILVGPGRTGGVWASTDGQVWTTRTFSAGDANVGLASVCYYNGLFVGVGADTSGEAAVMTSSDGITWTRRSLAVVRTVGFTKGLREVTRAGSLFFALGQSAGVLATSSDGLVWTQRTSPSPYVPRSVAWLSGTYCYADATDYFYTSTDGLNWTSRSGPRDLQFESVTAFGGRFVAASGNGAVHVSTDAITWDLAIGVPAPGYSNVSSVAYGAGRFVTSGWYGRDYYSDDGLLWKLTSNSIGNQTGGRLCYALGKFFCTDTDHLGKFWFSSDGSNWQSTQIIGFPTVLRKFEFVNGLLVALGSGGSFATSVDGVTWTNRSIGVDDVIWGFSCGNGRYVVATTWNIYSSTDLTNWTLSPQADVWVQGIKFGHGLFVGVGRNRSGFGRILSSPDGINWTERQPAGADFAEEVFDFDGQTFRTLGGGKLYSSEDGLDWRARVLPFGNGILFASDAHTMVIAGTNVFWRSTDSGEWIFITAQPFSRSVTVGSTTTFSAITSSSGVSFRWQYALPNSATWSDVRPDANFSGTDTEILHVSNVTFLQDGTRFRCVLRNEFDEVTSAVATLTVNRLNQTIAFAAPDDRVFTATPFTLEAAASSNLLVAFTVVSGPATLEGNTLTLTGPGVVTLRATQSGTDNYAPAEPVERSFIVRTTVTAWETEHFSAEELNNPAISSLAADPDGDGLANLLEYALGFDPRVATTASLPGISTSGTEWVFTYLRPADRSDVFYLPEYSTNLTEWNTDGITHERTATGATETWQARVPIGTGGNVFFRLRVTR